MVVPSSLTAVYVVGEFEPNDELRYSLRSLANATNHSGDVVLAGHRPDWAVNVHHIETRQRATTKYENSTGNLLAALEHPDLPEWVALWNDDFFAMAPTPVVPLHRGPVVDVLADYMRRYGQPTGTDGNYRQGMADTLDLLRSWGHEPLSWEVHAPMPVHRPTALEALNRARTERPDIVALHKRTVIGTVTGLADDPNTRYVVDQHIKLVGYHHRWRRLEPWLSTAARSWNGNAGVDIRRTFKAPSPHER